LVTIRDHAESTAVRARVRIRLVLRELGEPPSYWVAARYKRT
jgi:hypothetical protein